MNAEEIYNVLVAADVLGLIQVNTEEVLEQVLSNSVFLQVYDHTKEGDSVYRAVATLIELDRENPRMVSAKLAKQYPDYRVHRVTSVEHYISQSGNPTWKAFDEDMDVIYLRQAHKDLLEKAGLWATLNLMPIDAAWDCDIFIHTTKDGDFRKPVQIDPLGSIVVPVADVEPPHPPAPSPTRREGEMTTVEAAAAAAAEAMLKFPTANDLQKSVPVQADAKRGLRDEVMKWARTLVSGGGFVVLDTETSSPNGYPVEVSVIDPEGNGVFVHRIKLPEGEKIDYEAQRVHGISADDLKDCPEWGELASDFADAIKGKTVVIYNADFDLKVIHRANAKYGIPLTVQAECAMLKVAEWNGEWNDYHGNFRWLPLVQAAKKLGVKVSNAHSATGDALMTLEVIKALAAMAKTDESMPDKAPF